MKINHRESQEEIHVGSNEEMAVNEPIITGGNADKTEDTSSNSPAYYARLTPQTIQRLQDVLSPEEFQGFCRGNILKYSERMRHKDDPIKEAKKVMDYAKWLYESLKGEKISL